jgi:glycosyltransferase involved in cell wall biosynthesis
MVDLHVEKRVLYRADKIVAATPSYARDFRALAQQRSGADFVAITNGFDEEDFRALEGKVAHTRVPWEGAGSEKVTIAHVGYVFPGTAIPFLSALGRLKDVAHRIRVVFVGGLAVPDMAWLEEHPVPLELQFTKRVSHAVALYAMQSAHAVLLLVGDGADWLGHYPGKLFEYMRSGTPILLSGPDGAAAKLVEESGTGCTLPVDNTDLAAQTLRVLALDPMAFRTAWYRPSVEAIRRYERKRLAQQLGGLLAQVSDAPGAGRRQ